MQYRITLFEQRRYNATKLVFFEKTTDYLITPLEVMTRSAPTDGDFTPGTYKVTAMSASTKRVFPSSEGRTFEWEVVYRTSTYLYRATGDLDLFGNHAVYVNSALVAANSPRTVPFRNEALLRAFGNVGNLAQLELGQELGELRETYELLLHTILTLLKPRELWSNFQSALKVERKYQYFTPKVLKLMPSKYMEFRYGWMPLMRSIHDICQVLKEGLAKAADPNTIYTAHGRAKDDIVITTTPVLFSMGALRSEVNYLVCNTVTGRAAVHYKVLTPPTLGDLLGLTPKFIPETVWALSKCSFVWDWFFTLGPWLQALRGQHDWSYQILGNTVSATVVSEGSSIAFTRPANSTVKRQKSSAVVYQKSYQRWVNQPVPKPEIRASSVFDGWKILDLIILSSKYLPKQVRRDFIDALSLKRVNLSKYTE